MNRAWVAVLFLFSFLSGEVFAQPLAPNLFKARVDPDAEVTYHNPVIPGFYSDPRETCLAPVSWPKNGWPQVNGNGTVTLEMRVPLQPFPAAPSRVPFDEALGLEWNHVQSPEPERYSLDARPGYLRLRGSASTLGGGDGSPTFVARRLQHMYFTSTTRIEFDPATENEQAGLVLLSNGTHFDLLIKRSGGERTLVSRLQFGSVTHESGEVVLASGPVNLRIEGAREADALTAVSRRWHAL